MYQMASAHILDGQCSCIRRPVLVYLWGFKNGGQINLNFTVSKFFLIGDRFVRGDSLLKGRVKITGSPLVDIADILCAFD